MELTLLGLLTDMGKGTGVFAVRVGFLESGRFILSLAFLTSYVSLMNYLIFTEAQCFCFGGSAID